MVGTTDKADHWLRDGSLTLNYPGASYVKPHLDKLVLLPGDSLTVSNPSGTESATYRTGVLPRWAMSVDGDTAVLTLHRGRVAEAAGLGAHIDKVAHGFTAAEKSKQKGTDRSRRDAAIKAMRSGGRAESVCGSDDSADAVCYKSSDPVAYNNSRAVARLLINGDELCSAWRVGPNNRMFTNHHCFTTSDEAQNTEVWFNYECVQCGGYQTQPVTKVWGNQVLATDDTLDFTLFSVQNFSAIQGFGYLNLDVRDPAAGEELYIPQHPAGDPTVIAMDSDQDQGGNCQIQDPAADGYGTGTDASYYCDTAGGSSGSPVISRVSNKVIALHHFGGCPNAGVRIDLIYQKVKSLL
jgi:V8-like Glu-specific endopeptidase